jgi:protein tyrosine/serine phosphatase
MGVKGKFLSACAVAVLLGLPLAAPTTVNAKEAGSASAGIVGVSRIQIGNFGEVSTTYDRGEQPDGRDYADLAALGVRTVIDLQADGENFDEAQRVEAAGMRFYRIPMTTHVPPTSEQLATFLEIVNDPMQQPVYVHCAGGRHRTGVMTAIYRMEHDGWTADQAFREMKQYKFGMDVLHPEFKRFVYDYRPTASPSVLAARATD